ncbi:glycosyltransferase family 2 protein, partial [Bacteroides clarus]|uniref:glycosyltransferase family 2 protein n=1 Tax=Bacteroides clarus TaxID=626929 RepID=UPI00248DA6E3
MKALVSIITVNYNGLRDTCEMIDSFRSRETYPRYEIIVVDNGSRLPEAEEIQERYRDNPVPGGSLSGSPAADTPVSFPPVKVVRNINNGFAGGNNAGLKAAAGDYLFFINNDTLIKEPVLDALVRRIESDSPRNGGVSPMLKFAARPDTLQYAGFTPLSPVTLRNTAIGFMQQDSPRFRIPRETASLHGAAMMVSRRALQDAGTMSEVYFLFYEELDWSAQLRKAGYRLWYEPAAVVYHKEGMTARR